MRSLAVLLGIAAVAVAVQDGGKTVSTKASDKAPKKNRPGGLFAQYSKKTDVYCHQHHMSSGAPGCVHHSGCAYSKWVHGKFKIFHSKAKHMRDGPAKRKLEGILAKYGPCSSIDHHDHEYCAFYGKKSTRDCIKLSMCTWRVGKGSAKGKCESVNPPPSVPDIERQCSRNMGDADDKSYAKFTKCVRDSFKKSQKCHLVDLKDEESPKVVDRIKGALWYADKPECSNAATCGKRFNKVADDRCPAGYKFIYEFCNAERNPKKLGCRKGGCRDLYSYKAKCSAKDRNEFQAMQIDEDDIGFDGYFCVDKNGHEIANTRRKRPLRLFDINCNTKRKQHEGMQCPNAVTLTTVGGVVVVNKHRNKDCDVHCNSDTDCNGGKWCCFNGCGYKCKMAIKPLAGCANVPGHNQRKWKVTGTSPGAKNRHGISVTVGCAQNYAVVPKKGNKMPRQKVTLECRHGSWVLCDKGKDCTTDFKKHLDCKEDCPPFRLEGPKQSVLPARKLNERFDAAFRNGKDRARDFFVDKITGPGNARHHGATRTLTCPPGYGAVQHGKFLGQAKKGLKAKKSAKSLHIVRHGYEVIKCGAKHAGEWGRRHLECSVCYDAHSHQWRDVRGNACSHFRSRPAECMKFADQVVKAGQFTDAICGKWSTEWERVGEKMLESKAITRDQFIRHFKAYTLPEFRRCSRGLSPKHSNPARRCTNDPKKQMRRGGPRKCSCMPEWQRTFINAAEAQRIKNFGKTARPYNLPKVCGKIEKGAWVKVGKSGYFKTKTSFGSAVDNCRVACRSCEKAEIRYLQRSTYSVKEYKAKVAAKKLNCAKKGAKAPCKEVYRQVTRKELRWHQKIEKKVVTKTIVRSVPTTAACAGVGKNKGQTALKCGVKNLGFAPPPICRGFKGRATTKVNSNGCPRGFKPMA